MSYTLLLGGDAATTPIAFENKSYHFIARKLWFFELKDDDGTLTLTHQMPMPVAYRMYDYICAHTIRHRNIMSDQTSSVADRKAADEELTVIVSRYTDYLYRDTVKSYILTSRQWYSVDDIYNDHNIMWYDNNDTLSAFTSPPRTTSCNLYMRTTKDILLGDYYYFVLDDKNEGLRRWQLAADNTTYMPSGVAAIHVAQYTPRTMTRNRITDIHDKYMVYSHSHYPVYYNASIAFHLGNLYKDTDEGKSTTYYRQAACLGNVYAAYEMGNRSVTVDEKLNWYTFAATGRHPRAEYELGMLLHRERTDKHAEAMTWLYLASLHGIVEAGAKVAELQRNSSRNVVVVLHTIYDYNGSFASVGTGPLDLNIPNFVDKFDFAYIYTDSMTQITQRLAEIGRQRKIAHLIIMAHGTHMSVRLARNWSINISNVDTLAQLLQPLLAPSSSIMFNACLVGCGGSGADNFAQALANKLPGHTVWGAGEIIDDDDVTISHCAPDSTETFLNITYETTRAAVTIHSFTYIPAFRAILRMTYSNNVYGLTLAADGKGTVRIGNNILIDVPFTTIGASTSTFVDDYITLTVDDITMEIQMPDEPYIQLTITGDVRIVSSTLFQACLLKVTDCGNRLLPEKCFEDCARLITMPNTVKRDVLPTNLNSFFNGCTSLKTRMDNWDVGAVTTMAEMFRDCVELESVGAHWDTGRVTDMAGMFHDCNNFNDALNHWDVSYVRNMSDMFRGCSSFNQPLDRWNVSNVTHMTRMFQDCDSFHPQHVPNTWNVSAVKNRDNMFARVYKPSGM